MFIASTHHYIMFFTNLGRCYWLKVHELPQVGKAGKGRAIVNMIQIRKKEKITAFVNVKEFTKDAYLMMATRHGMVKKTVLSAYGNPRRDGINAIKLNPGDELIEVKLTDGNSDIILATSNGMAIRFNEREVRGMGRVATGVRGINLEKGDYVIGMVVVKREGTLLSVSELGFGKRTNIKEYRVTHRAGKGIKNFKVNEKTGKLISIMEVVDNDDLILISSKGVLLRIHVGNIRTTGRDTMGVHLMRLDSGDMVSDVARIITDDEETE